MTEIASPLQPDPAHADTPATNGTNNVPAAHHVQSIEPPPPPRPFDASDSDGSLSPISLSDFELTPEPAGPQQSAPPQTQSSPRAHPNGNGVNGTNGHAHDSDTMDDGPPAKRRRVRDSTPVDSMRRSKAESPPWKKIEAEGPSTFVAEDGRRKSGRINLAPLELHNGDKRTARNARPGQQANPPANRKHAHANGVQAPSPATSVSGSKRSAPSGKQAPAKPPAPKANPRKPANDAKSNAKGRRRSTSPKRPSTPAKPAVGTRRSSRQVRDNHTEDEATSPSGTRTTPRIKLRTRPPLTEIPLVHRDQANIRPKLGPTFEEYFARAGDIPVEQGGLFLAEDGPRYTDEMARHDAQVILRVEQEVQPGGLLAMDRCSIFEPEAEEEPPRQWAHQDHLNSAMADLRRRMLLEQQRHRAHAKRLAIACQAEWRRRNPQPKTAEELEAEELEKSRARWRQVNKAIAGTWENIKAEINRRRLAEWEAEEQRRVKAALNQAVNLSEQKLQARQTRHDTEDDLTDSMEEEDDDDDMDSALDGEEGSDDGIEDTVDNASEGDESNMSSDDDDEDKGSVVSDEGLTQEQLMEKYANLPSLEEADGGSEKVDSGAETSDESVDMDDDLGSTEDESSDDEEDSGSDGDAEESDDEPGGLLGLFFKKSELKKLNSEVAEVDATEQEDVDMIEPDTPAEPSEPEQPSHGKVWEGQTGLTPPSLAEVLEITDIGGACLPNGTHDADKPPISSPSDQVLTLESAQPSASVEAKPVPVSSPELATPLAATELANGVAEDVDMVDVTMTEQHGLEAVPAVEISAPPSNTPHGDSNGQEPADRPVDDPNQPGGPTSGSLDEAKVDGAETPTSQSLLNVPKSDSRSTSPLPAVPRTEIPFLLRGTLREYQHLGLDWLAALYANNTNGILADEMGLGKTIQTIALLAHLACHHEVWGPHLVIVPTSVMLNWEMEFKKWCPGFKILTYYGNQEERKRKRHGWTNDDVWNVCITSYQMVLQDQQVFRRRRWHYMILDEAHNIKNFKSQRWQTLLGFNTHSRLLLTGTPLQNNLTELWSLLYFLAPPENGEGGFVDLSEFHNWFARPESQILESGREQLDDEARAIISKLHKVLRPYLLRRLKADVEKQMPAKYEHVEFCRLSKRQRELYDGFLSRADTRQTLSSGNYMSIINCLMQLRKVCNHPDLFVDRPIMTSFRMHRSVPADFTLDEVMIRRKLLAPKPMSSVSLSFLNMVPAAYEGLSTIHTDRIVQLSSPRTLLDLREAQKVRANNAYTTLDPATVKSNIVYLESAGRWGRFEELQHCVYLNALRRQQRPIYGKSLVNLLTLETHRRPFKQRPKVPAKIMSWFEEDSFALHSAIQTLPQRAASMETTITKFACVTPAVVTGDIHRFVLGEKGIEAFQETDLRLSAPVRHAPYMPKEPPQDPWHEARMRLSIQFPDKRLLQYDCGKLQALDKLLRKLQAGGHRALIFTQMTKVLDILELFLNIHGHKYLRLDGSTKVEQRQILTDRFNVDTRILCFILSTRSGGLGINLTGADTVIFYDQDWNPAMDKQCQDRCHRIGQTRDVHIYRLVSEHTIEANILRKASQKQMLDDVVIQEGEFTTDYFHKISVRDVINNSGEVSANENDVVANAAMDRVLGGVESSRGATRVLEQAEDKEDVAAARRAEKEIQQDDADFLEQQPASASASASGVSSVRQGTPRDGAAAVGGKASGLGVFSESVDDFAVEAADPAVEEVEVEVERNAWGERMRNIDEFMLGFMAKALENTPLELPRDKKRSRRRGKDTRKR
ncbi:helicase swr-1 [Podospora conica]|nr:helicase swr-1 [Schizothecium conicum]